MAVSKAQIRHTGPPNAVKPTAKSLVKPMGTVVNPNDPDPLLPENDEENMRFVIQLYDESLDCPKRKTIPLLGNHEVVEYIWKSLQESKAFGGSITLLLHQGDCEVLYDIDEQTKTITFHAIIIPETAQGQGIGKKLALFAFDYAIENNLDVVIKCCFLAEYFMKQRTCKKYASKYSKLRVTGRYPPETIDKNY